VSDTNQLAFVLDQEAGMATSRDTTKGPEQGFPGRTKVGSRPLFVQREFKRLYGQKVGEPQVVGGDTRGKDEQLRRKGERTAAAVG